MLLESDGSTTDALGDVAYLSLSIHRVRILRALTEEPYTRRDLEDVTDASRATLGRILSELEDRGWAERTADGYVATVRGELVCEVFVPLLEAIGFLRRLEDAADSFPTEARSVDLRHFTDSTVRRPRPTDAFAPVAYGVSVLREAEYYRGLVHSGSRPFLDAVHEGVCSGRLDAEVVSARSYLEYLVGNPNCRSRVVDLLERGCVLRYDGAVPTNLLLVDDCVYLCLCDRERGHLLALVESENGVVRSWAVDLYEAYRAKADLVDAESVGVGLRE